MLRSFWKFLTLIHAQVLLTPSTLLYHAEDYERPVRSLMHFVGSRRKIGSVMKYSSGQQKKICCVFSPQRGKYSRGKGCSVNKHFDDKVNP
jgi:hypothetical protein